MNGRHQKEHRYSEADTRRWLHAIARGMKQTGRSTLFIEELQPGVFLRRREKIAYVFLTRCLAGIIFGVAAGAIHQGLSLNIERFTAGMPACWGLGAGFATAIAATLRLSSRILKRFPLRSDIAIDVFRAVLITGVAAIGILAAHTIFLLCTVDFESLRTSQLEDLFLGDVLEDGHVVTTSAVAERLVLIGFVAILNGVMGLKSMGRAFIGDIESVETLGYSTKDAIPGFIAGGLVSFVLSIAYVAIVASVVGDHPGNYEPPDPLIDGFGLLTLPAICRSLAITIVGVVIGGTFHGLKPHVQEQKLIPNYGIILSVRHCLMFGIALGTFAGTLWGCCIGTTELQVSLSRRSHETFQTPELAAFESSDNASSSTSFSTPILPTDVDSSDVDLSVAGDVSELVDAPASPMPTVDNVARPADEFPLSEGEETDEAVIDPVPDVVRSSGLANNGLRAALFGGFGVYLVASFWFGGLDVMRHYSLRFLLGVFGYVPMRIVPFLDYVEKELSFVVRTGGAYRFMHRYLLEYFADHDPDEPEGSLARVVPPQT